MAFIEIKHQAPNWDTPVNDMFKELYDLTTNVQHQMDENVVVDKANQHFVLTNGASVEGLGDGLRIWRVQVKGSTDIYGSGSVSFKGGDTSDRFRIMLPYYCTSGDFRVGNWFDWDPVSFQIEENSSISVIHKKKEDSTVYIFFHIHRPNW